jgi:hypothetical protein
LCKRLLREAESKPYHGIAEENRGTGIWLGKSKDPTDTETTFKHPCYPILTGKAAGG